MTNERLWLESCSEVCTGQAETCPIKKCRKNHRCVIMQTVQPTADEVKAKNNVVQSRKKFNQLQRNCEDKPCRSGKACAILGCVMRHELVKNNPEALAEIKSVHGIKPVNAILQKYYNQTHKKPISLPGRDNGIKYVDYILENAPDFVSPKPAENG